MGIMRGDLKVLACLVIAYANVVASYNPYAYNARFVPETVGPDAYASMGDISWVKRNIEEPVRDYLKRAANPYSYHYKYKQPYMRPRPQKDPYQPYRAYSRFSGSISKPQTRNTMNYFGMADADWGWKKRSQWPAMVELDNMDDVDDTLDEDNLDLEKKNIGSLAQTNMFPKGHKLTFGKRTNIDESDATDDENNELFDEEKRHVGSTLKRSGIRALVRDGNLPSSRSRRSGIQALVRDGDLRNN